MWYESEHPGIGERIDEDGGQLDQLEAVYTYLNEKSGMHLPFVSEFEDKRGDGRKYKWIVGNGRGGSWMGRSPFGLNYGITKAGNVNPHEYAHGVQGHQTSKITALVESHANFLPWLGEPQGNPVDTCPARAHIYPSDGTNYYQAYLIWDHLLKRKSLAVSMFPDFGIGDLNL